MRIGDSGGVGVTMNITEFLALLTRQVARVLPAVPPVLVVLGILVLVLRKRISRTLPTPEVTVSGLHVGTYVSTVVQVLIVLCGLLAIALGVVGTLRLAGVV